MSAALVRVAARLHRLPVLVLPRHYCERHDDGTPARYALTVEGAPRRVLATLCAPCAVALVERADS